MPRSKLFKNMKLQEKWNLFFLENGFTVAVNRSRYNVYTDGVKFYFIGKNGAIRFNNKNSASGSRSLTGIECNINRRFAEFCLERN